MKLSEFKDNHKNKNNDTVESQEQPKQDKTIEQLFNQYKDLSSNDLMKELLNNVEKSKQNGTFDFSKLSKTIEQVLPYLSSEQQNSILTILNQIK